ncbi:MAG: hypothetical protein GF317_04595 [Candidatus Lokiarchaeota archaeon]|nr:hypothetical protein [Candidatus Lokiarchaeota archaeon]
MMTIDYFKKLRKKIINEYKRRDLIGRIRFYIEGHPADVPGNYLKNPMPAPRLNYKMRHTKKSIDYETWKSYVWESFNESLEIITFGKVKEGELFEIIDDNKDIKMRINAFIIFNVKLAKRGDPENIIKGITDALIHVYTKGRGKRKVLDKRLLRDDNNVVTNYDYSEGKIPAIEVVIDIFRIKEKIKERK